MVKKKNTHVHRFVRFILRSVHGERELDDKQVNIKIGPSVEGWVLLE